MKLPRFTLRDLFWLVLVAAMGCAWWADRRTLVTSRDSILKVIKQAGWELTFDKWGKVVFFGVPR